MSAMRDRYLRDTVSTATPGKLLVMLYERLVLDLAKGEQAQRDGDRETAAYRLTHAQEIVLELRASLDLEVWSEGAALANIYVYLLNELIMANVKLDADRTATCRMLVEPLLEAWREAASTTAGEPQRVVAQVG